MCPLFTGVSWPAPLAKVTRKSHCTAHTLTQCSSLSCLPRWFFNCSCIFPTHTVDALPPGPVFTAAVFTCFPRSFTLLSGHGFRDAARCLPLQFARRYVEIGGKLTGQKFRCYHTEMTTSSLPRTLQSRMCTS